MPAVSFCEGITPFIGAERRLERTVEVFAPHQLSLTVKNVFIVPGPGFIKGSLFLRPSKLLRQLPQAPVCVGILQCTRHILIYAHIVWYITQAVVVFSSVPADGMHRTVAEGVLHQCLPQGIDIISPYSLQIGISYQ
ncbi:MAG: hypothetical protein BWY89_00821 [Bacteroidetes bacterium ADurb.BinA012]|nr:MAG: hypothetical protein BWY89_00821 [Bacteroidetes bacterium ADurb.BinA012]